MAQMPNDLVHYRHPAEKAWKEQTLVQSIGFISVQVLDLDSVTRN